MAFDIERAQEYALRVWKYKEGDVITTMMRIGDALGLYAAMVDAGPVTAAQLADGLDYDERFVTEWLYTQAAAGLVDHEDGVFSLIEEAESVLVNEDSLLHAAGVFSPPVGPEHFAGLLEAFRTGRGLTYEDMGEAVAEQVDRSGAAWLRTFLPMVVVPQLEGVPQRLTAGAMVLEIGCGGGVALEPLAKMYPESTFLGIDPSAVAAARARQRLAAHPNVEIRKLGAEDLASEDGPYDLVMALDCLHDMPRPDIAARKVRSVLSEDGTWLIKEIRSGGSYVANERNPVRGMVYGFSVTTCLPSGTSEDGALALGTLGLGPERLTEMMTDAGFSQTRQLGTDDPVHFYYEVKI